MHAYTALYIICLCFARESVPLNKFLLHPVALQSIVMSMSVCASVSLPVCLSVHSHNSKTVRPNFTKFLYILPVAVAESSDSITIHYLLTVVWMMSSFHTMGLSGCTPPHPDYSVPHPSSSPSFLHRMPVLPQPSKFILAWDRQQVCWLAYSVGWYK